MNRKFVVAAAGCVAALVFSSVPAWAGGQDSSSNQFAGAVTERIDGKDRIDTNMKVVAEQHPGLTKPYHAYLARADLGFDALSASPLTFKGPVILVDTHADPKTVTANQLDPLGIHEVTIVGGPGAVPDKFVNGLGVKVRERIWGPDRYGTNLAAAKQAFPDPQTIFMIRGNGAGDGEAALAASLTKFGPVLFVGPRGCNAEQKAWVESNPHATVSIIGNAPDYPAKAGQRRISRIGFSQTPERVSALVAKQTFPSGNPKMYIARSDTLADAIAAANIIYDGPVVLVNPAGFPADALLAAKDLRATTVVALGGEAAIPESVLSLFRVKSGVKPVPGSGGNPGAESGATPNANGGKVWNNTDPLKRSMFIKDNPGWEEPTQYTPALDKGLVHGWKRLKGTVATPVHDPALDKVAESGSGSAGMLTIVPKGDPYDTPALPMLGPGLTDQWSDPLFGCQPGDIARTAVGDYVITKVTYGRHVSDVKAIQQYIGGEYNMIGVSPVWVVKVEGTLVGGNGQEQMIDASGVTVLVRDGKPVE